MIYDAFQRQAIKSTQANNSVIVCAPTGAGKTAIAEHVIEQCLENNKNVVYTAPIKALSNQKFRDFGKVYKDKIGILTGDVSLNPNASVLIMTTEIYRNTLLENPRRLENISWVIFDEIHYLDDFERGTVWEESIIFSPEHVRILGLSATVPNASQLAAWITNIHAHQVDVILEKNRPVPLHHCFQSQDQTFYNIDNLRKNIYLGAKPKRKGYRRSRQREKRIPSNKLSSLLHYLQKTHKMPAIYFAFSRKKCEKLAFETKHFNFIDPSEQKQLCNLTQKLFEKFSLESEPSAVRIRPLLLRGIGYHHAGLLPSLKEVIEQLFTSKLIKLIFTTETFALGINMPAKTVVFDELRKFYGYSFAELRTRDYYQMAGRAGRRAIDTEGFVFSRINPHRINIAQIKKMIYGKPEPVLSQFNLSYASILHLYAKWQEKLYEIYPLTLHYFQSNKKSRKHALDLMRIKINFLKALGYIKNNQLTSKGDFAASIYGYELIITELFSAGLLEKLTTIELCIVLAALVFEPRKGQHHIKLSHEILKIHKLTVPISDSALKSERKFRINPPSKKPYFNLAEAIMLWINQATLAKVKEHTNADEGEIVRYFRMVIQLLRQLRAIDLINEQFRQKINQALAFINRDEVDAEKQLREGLD